MRALDSRFPPDFREWVANLQRLFLWRKAGYQIQPEELTFEQWQALAVISRYHEVKDLEALAIARQVV